MSFKELNYTTCASNNSTAVCRQELAFKQKEKDKIWLKKDKNAEKHAKNRESEKCTFIRVTVACMKGRKYVLHCIKSTSYT